MSSKAEPGPAPPAGTTFSAHRAPIQHDEIAGLDGRDVRPDFVYYARGLMSEKERKFVANAALAVVRSVWQTPHAWMRTTTSPGPGSGTTTVTSDTGSPLAIATTPWTSDAIVCSLSILASLYSGLLLDREPCRRRGSMYGHPERLEFFRA